METVRLDNVKKNEYFTPGCLRGRGQKFSVRRNWPHGFRQEKQVKSSNLAASIPLFIFPKILNVL